MRVCDVRPSIPGREHDERTCRTIQLSADQVKAIFDGFKSNGAAAIMAPGNPRSKASARLSATSQEGQAPAAFAAPMPPQETLVGLLISPTEEEMEY